MAVRNRDKTEWRCQIKKEGVDMGDVRNTFVMFIRCRVFAFWKKK